MLEFLIPNNILCHAVEAMLFVSVATSVLGVIITRIGISSVGFTMAHAAFAGAAIGMFLLLPVTVSAIAASIAVALLIGPLSEKAKLSVDATLGVLFSLSMAVAIFFISYMQTLGQGFNASSLLYGDVISLYREEVYSLALIALIVIVFVILFYKEITALIFHRKIAESTGIRVKPVYYGMLFIIAVSIALSLTIIGGLLLYVWLVTPAVIVYQFSYNLRHMFFLAPVVAGVISVGGAFTGITYSLPVAPLTAVVFGVVFLVAVLISPKRRISNSKN